MFAWIIRHFGPGLGAIALAAAVLLLSDLPRAAKSEKTFNVAMLQMASQPIMDDGANGVISGLEKAGFAQGGSLVLSRFNAEGDMATANSMAAELVGGGYDLVITLTTSCLQAVGNANRRGGVRHVFGLVSDPTVSGVGIEKEPLAHPAHMVGIGTLPPVGKSFELARKMNPKLKRVGVVWNPAEVNSEIATKAAREISQQLGIELIEANAENASAVKEAVASVVARDVDALWIGGDVTVLAAVDVVLQAARRAKIPVFTSIPGNAAKGAIFDVGANYSEVGQLVGSMAAKVLNGAEIANIPWETAIPPKLFINTTATKDLDDTWTIPQSLLDQADSIIDESGEHNRKVAAPAHASTPMRNLCLLSYINSSDVDDAERGLKAGLKEAGLLENSHYRWKSLNAQGDMGRESGLLAGRILKGESISRMDLKPITTNRLMLNLVSAEECGLKMPSSLIETADLVVRK